MNLFSFSVILVKAGGRRALLCKVFKTVMTAEWRADLSNELCVMFCQLALRSLYIHMCTLLPLKIILHCSGHTVHNQVHSH